MKEEIDILLIGHFRSDTPFHDIYNKVRPP